MQITKLTILPKANVSKCYREAYTKVLKYPSIECATEEITNKLNLIEKFNGSKLPSKIIRKIVQARSIPSFVNVKCHVDTYI